MTIIPLSIEERAASGLTHAVTVDYTDVTQSTLIALPAGSVVGRVSVGVSTVWNSGTSAAISVGTTASATVYINAQNLLAAGSRYYLYNTGAVITAASQFLVVTLAVAGTAATAGKCTIGLQLVDLTQLPVAA